MRGAFCPIVQKNILITIVVSRDQIRCFRAEYNIAAVRTNAWSVRFLVPLHLLRTDRHALRHGSTRESSLDQQGHADQQHNNKDRDRFSCRQLGWRDHGCRLLQ